MPDPRCAPHQVRRGARRGKGGHPGVPARGPPGRDLHARRAAGFPPIRLAMRTLFISSTRLGDAILTSGALAWVLRRAPDARVTVACGPVATGLFEAVPGVERVVAMRKGPWQAQWRTLWREAAGEGWGPVVDLRGPLSGGKRKRLNSRH